MNNFTREDVFVSKFFIVPQCNISKGINRSVNILPIHLVIKVEDLVRDWALKLIKVKENM